MGALLSSLVFPGKGRSRSALQRACECAGYELRDGNALIAFSHPPAGCTPVLYSHGNAEDLVDCIGSRGNLKLVFYEYPGYGCLHEQERSEAPCPSPSVTTGRRRQQNRVWSDSRSVKVRR